jgi:hypothetical protein
MTFRIFLFFLLSALIQLEGCIMAPAPTKEDKVLAGKPVTEEQLSFLTPKITTKEDVIARLGSPNVIWEDACVFIYHWDIRQGILFWAVGAYYAGGAGMKDIAKHYLLLIEFDAQGRVLRFDRTTRPLSQPYAAFLTEWLGSRPTASPADLCNQGGSSDELSDGAVKTPAQKR